MASLWLLELALTRDVRLQQGHPSVCRSGPQQEQVQCQRKPLYGRPPSYYGSTNIKLLYCSWACPAFATLFLGRPDPLEQFCYPAVTPASRILFRGQWWLLRWKTNCFYKHLPMAMSFDLSFFDINFWPESIINPHRRLAFFMQGCYPHFRLETIFLLSMFMLFSIMGLWLGLLYNA